MLPVVAPNDEYAAHAATLAQGIVDGWAKARSPDEEQVGLLRQALRQTKVIAVAHGESTNAHFASAWSPEDMGGTGITACHVFTKAKGSKVKNGDKFSVLMEAGNGAH